MKRSKEDIVQGVLTACIDGTGKTAVIYRVNLNSSMANRYMDFLLKGGLIEANREGSSVIYRTTPQGVQVLSNLKDIKDLLQNLDQYFDGSGD